MKNWYMIIAFPKTGSSWLGNVIRDHTEYDYLREYFNPLEIAWKGSSNKNIINNIDKHTKIKALECAFGSEHHFKYVALPWEIHKRSLEFIFKEVWQFTPENKIVDKEIWSWNNIGFFIEYFNIIILHRKSDVIFWGNGTNNNLDAYKYYKAIYDSFLLNADYYDYEFRKQIVEKSDIYDQCLLAHTLATKILFKEAEKYKLPIIHYEDMVTQDARVYLQDKLPESLRTDAFLAAVEQWKFKKDFLDKRKQQHLQQVDIRFKKRNIKM